MSNAYCDQCRVRLPKRSGRGRPSTFCSGKCRQLAYRNRAALPPIMRNRNVWTRAIYRRPVTVDGGAASSTNPATWGAFDAVQEGVGGGFGIMLGNGLGCYDLDHVSDDDAWAFIATIPEPILYVERSMSGTGFHVFIEAEECKGWKRVIDGVSVERYTRARFIRVTLNRVTRPRPLEMVAGRWS